MSVNMQMAFYFVAGPLLTIAAIVALIFVVLATVPVNAADPSTVSCEIHRSGIMAVTCHHAHLRRF